MICSMCQGIFRADLQFTRVQAGAVTPLTYPHYSSGELLHAAVQAGCHICTLIWHRMSMDAQLGAKNGYHNGWTHEPSMVGFIWYSVIANEANMFGNKTDVLTVYLRYGYGPKEMPLGVVATSEEYAEFKVVPPIVGKTVALLAKPMNIKDLPPLDRPFSGSTDSDGTWALIKDWLEHCDTSHARCKKNIPNSRFAPTRLLDVSSSNAVSLHVTDSQASRYHYLSLSHCWGKIQITRLLKANIMAFRKEVPIIDFPKTFQEAITITRRLGFRYIWIDSLCIVQDSLEDWQQEAARMGDVYKHAVLNIAATGSSDGNGGCFSDRDPLVVQPCIIDSSWLSAPGKYRMYDSALWRHGVNRAPLNTRAWVVQERILAQRALHFGESQLFWECSDFLACETFPKGYPTNQAEDVFPRFGGFFFDDIQGYRSRSFSEEWAGLLDPDPQFRNYDLWSDIVVAFTKCHLSYKTDKLIALSGLAKETQKKIDDDYLAGLWKKNLPHHLLWFHERPSVQTQSPKPEAYCAPSWSWASTTGEVVDYPITNISGERLLIDIISAQTDTATSDKTGQCTGGRIQLRGRLTAVNWSWNDEDELYYFLLGDSTVDFSLVFPDRSDYIMSDAVFALPIHLFDVSHDEPRMYGLVLEIVDGTTNTFKRVGQFKIDYDYCGTFASDDVALKQITII